MGLNNKDISVYIFLFVKKWIEKQAPLSSSKIYKDLVSITNFFPPKLGITYSEKSVSVSLKKLVTMGFVSRCINDQKIKSEGRPATALYESDTIDLMRNRLDRNITFAS